MRKTATYTAPSQNLVADVFNLSDPAERFIVEVLQRFHEDGRCRAHVLRRTTDDKGQRVIVELARFCGHSPKWEVIYWNPDELSVRFQPCQDRASAVAAYQAEPLMSLTTLQGLKMPTPKPN